MVVAADALVENVCLANSTCFLLWVRGRSTRKPPLVESRTRLAAHSNWTEAPALMWMLRTCWSGVKHYSRYLCPKTTSIERAVSEQSEHHNDGSSLAKVKCKCGDSRFTIDPISPKKCKFRLIKSPAT